MPARRDALIDRDTFYRFYASEFSYFSAKLRPALRYKRVPYVELLATPEAYQRVIIPRTGLAFIPVLVTPDGETWQDTSDILDALERRFPDPSLYPSSGPLRVIAYLVELYADEFLILRDCTIAGVFRRAPPRRAPISPRPTATSRWPISSPIGSPACCRSSVSCPIRFRRSRRTPTRCSNGSRRT